MKLTKSTYLALVAVLLSPIAANADLITNGGFETGDLTGWTCIDADLCDAGGPANTGMFSMQGFDNTGFATLSQIISTVAGATYDFSFFSFAPDLAGNILRYQLGSDPIMGVALTDTYAMTSASFVASGAATTLSFYFETDGGTGTWRIDDVSVTAAAAVPEPGTLALLGIGLAGMGLYRRKKA